MNPATGQTLAEAPLATEREVDAAVDRGRARVRRVAVHAADAARAADVARSPTCSRRTRTSSRRSRCSTTASRCGRRRPSTSRSRSSCCATTRAGRRRSRARSCRTRSPGCSRSPSASRSAWSRRSRRGTSRCSRSAYKLGPALAAGCTIVIKPSELAPLSTLRLMQLVDEAGFPPGVVNVVIGGPDVGARARAASGRAQGRVHRQTATGKEIMRTAVDGLKRVTLELGGKSPNIVFADADLDGGRERRVRRDLLQPGAGLRRRLPPVRRGAGRRRARRPRRRAGGGDPPGLGPGPRDADGTADLRGAPRARARLRRLGARAGRRGRRRRRRRVGRGVRGRVLPRAHRAQPACATT